MKSVLWEQTAARSRGRRGRDNNLRADSRQCYASLRGAHNNLAASGAVKSAATPDASETYSWSLGGQLQPEEQVALRAYTWPLRPQDAMAWSFLFADMSRGSPFVLIAARLAAVRRGSPRAAHHRHFSAFGISAVKGQNR
jgi:hypothetical protein